MPMLFLHQRIARFGDQPQPGPFQPIMANDLSRQVQRNCGNEFALFVQLNDLYHIDTSADPAQSASRVLPRVATLLRRLREQFEDLWRRYLPHVAASESPQTAGAAATPPQPAPLSEKPAQPSRHTTPVVADREQDANPHQQTDVADVADTTPLPGDEGFRDSLNSAYAAGQITHRERHERRISHDHIRRGMGQSA